MNGENSERLNMEMRPDSQEPINPHTDYRLKSIYERYHTGKPIILDDLRYLWRNDPEGCAKLTRSILGLEHDEKQEDHNLVTSVPLVMKKLESMEEQPDHKEFITSSEKPYQVVGNIRASMEAIKLMLEEMSDQQLMEMMNHINTVLAAEKVASKMKYWEDSFEDKMMIMNPYETEKKFNILA